MNLPDFDNFKKWLDWFNQPVTNIMSKTDNWFFKDRDATSYDIIVPKIILSLVSIFIVFLVLKIIISDYEIWIFLLIVIGWILTSIRIWWSNRTTRRLSHYDDLYGFSCKQKISLIGKRNYGDIIPVYIINYPILILIAYFFVTDMLPIIFGDSRTERLSYIFAFALGFALDGIWEIFKDLPNIFIKK